MQVETAIKHYKTNLIQFRLARFGEAMITRYEENPQGGYLSPAELVQLPGYEYLKNDSLELFQVERVQLSDAAWRFQRIGAWFESPYDVVGNSEYLSINSNSCGTGSFSTATSWCGRAASIWMKAEDRQGFGELLLGEKQRLVRTMSKLAKRFNRDGTFTPLAAGSFRTLPQLVGYSGTPEACAGVFAYNEIPLTCDDLFNVWGNPISLNQISDRHIALVNRTQIFNASGLVVRLAEEIKVE